MLEICLMGCSVHLFLHPSSNVKLYEMQKELDLIQTKLFWLSGTCRVCRSKSCYALKKKYDDIFNVLTNEIDAQESKDVAQSFDMFHINNIFNS